MEEHTCYLPAERLARCLCAEVKPLCFQVVVLEKTLEITLDSKEIKTVSPKGNQPRIFIGRGDAEVPIIWPPM